MHCPFVPTGLSSCILAWIWTLTTFYIRWINTNDMQKKSPQQRVPHNEVYKRYIIIDKFKQYFLRLMHYTSNPDYLATWLMFSYSACTKQHNSINDVQVKKPTIGGFSIVYVLKSYADFLRDFNMYIMCTTSEYNTVNNIQPVFN